MNKSKIYKYIILTVISFLMVFLPLVSARAEKSVEILNIEAGDAGGKAIKIEWSANTPARGKILYGTTKDNLPYFVIDINKSKYHSVKIGNLKEKTEYYYQIIAYNNFGQFQSFVKKIKTAEAHDKIPPKIKNARAAYVSGTAAVIKWETDEKSSSKVEYGINGNYKKRSGGKKRTTDHMVVIKRLKPNTQYFLRLYSVDKDKNKSRFVYKEFSTRESGEQDKGGLSISFLRPSGPDDPYISATNIKVAFKTSRYAKGIVRLKKKWERAKTKTADYGLNHSVVFTGLLPGVKYGVEVSMKDIFGKKAKENFFVLTKKISGREDGYGDEEQADDIITLGEEYFRYTPATALYKAAESPAVYSIVKKQRHRVETPESFFEYGYNWSDVKVITLKKLLEYPPAKLIKSPENPTIYYLYERPEGKLLKLISLRRRYLSLTPAIHGRMLFR